MKWLLIVVAALLVIAITVGITVVVTRDGSEPDGKASPTDSDVASANDTGPVSIITFEPTCPAWRSIQDTLANGESDEWGRRDPSSESSSWSTQLRAQYEAAGAAMRGAADQVVVLAKQTPHRVMREIYEQFMAYGRAYADSLSSYRPKDDLLSRVNIHLSTSIAGVCDAIDRGGIAARASLVGPAQPPTTPPQVGDVNDPGRFVSESTPSCSAWVAADTTFRSHLDEWERLDSAIPASAWTADQRGIAEGAAQNFDSYSATIERLGRQAGGVFGDFANLIALYLSAYSASVPSYTASDSWIPAPGVRLNSATRTACKAAEG